MTTTLRALAAALATAALALPEARAIDVFSPGDLARAHASLSGLENCTKCHPAGKQLSQQACLDCHKELAPRIGQGLGLHGRLAVKDRDCWTCHHDHQGRDFTMVDWGPGGQKKFDHAKTGTPLAGKHAQAACERCHDPKLIRDPALKAMLAQQPQRRTFLGTSPLAACASCHFDEHRGQVGQDCKRCHGENAWKPAGTFDHAKTEYPLTGKHVKVECAKCHKKLEDPQGKDPRGALTAPVSATYVRYRPLPFASCLDCHKDPHENRFGPTCTRCHVTDDWKRIVSEGLPERAFHDRTRYPLRGGHATVACVACHGPWPGEPARFKNMAFQACTDCHGDSHLGQFARRGAAAGACDRCHDVNGWQPARFGPEEHARTSYKLEGAHRVVACVACHPRDPDMADRAPAQLRQELVRRGRPVRISLGVYHLAGDLARCETCHADPHAGQLQRKEGCVGCHGLESFRKPRFDHARDSKFALVGKHAQAACASCHKPDAALAGGAVRYKPLPMACAGCHADPHAAQFVAAAQGGATDCARCHVSEDWKKLLFQHRPPFTDYTLVGKHLKVDCQKCHPAVQVAGVAVKRYRPLPRACEGCHADFHKGAFRGFEPTRPLR